jgi:hypothetical protein
MRVATVTTVWAGIIVGSILGASIGTFITR